MCLQHYSFLSNARIHGIFGILKFHQNVGRLMCLRISLCLWEVCHCSRPLSYLNFQVRRYADLVMKFSLLRGSRFCVGVTSMDHRLESADEEEGEARCCFCNEPWNIVSSDLARKTTTNTKSSKCRCSLYSQDHLFSCIVCKS